MYRDSLDVLLVDDNEDDTYMMQEAFTQSQLVNILSIVRDGEEALAYLRRQGAYKTAPRPGLVLLDINMPKKNGFEVLLEVKDDPLICYIPVIMLTTSEREEDVVRCYSNGACTFISKPADIAKLKQTVLEFAVYWRNVAKIPTDERRSRHA